MQLVEAALDQLGNNRSARAGEARRIQSGANGRPLRVSVLYEGAVASDHGGRRILEQMTWLAAEGCDVSLAPVLTEGESHPELSPEIEQRGIRVVDAVHVSRRRPSQLTRSFPSVSARSSDLLRVERIARDSDWVIWGNTWHAVSANLVRIARSNAAVVSWDGDSVSRWYTTYARWLRGRDNARALSRNISAVSAMYFERRLMRDFDFLTLPGPADVAAVQRHSRESTPITIIPNVVRIGERLPASGRHVAKTIDALFVGSSYGPNVDGLRWLLTEVWPGVQAEFPGTRLTVAGRGLFLETVFPHALPLDGVEFIGGVSDLAGLYASAKVALLPVFYGSGVPNKVLEALAIDSAMVLSPYVADALGEPHRLRTCSGADEWVRAIGAALADPRGSRVNRHVRDDLLAIHGVSGFEHAMRNALSRVKRQHSSSTSRHS